MSRLPRRVLVPLIVACALFMENLDSTVIATAVPDIARSLGTEPLHLSLGITSYLLSLAVFIPLSGWIADRYGGRDVFRCAIALFTLGSVLCGLSDSLVELVLARVVQGLGGAMMIPVGRLLLFRSVKKSELVSAMAYLTTPALVGPAIGPPLGGFIATYWSWRGIFFINVPIGLLGLVLVTRYIPKTPPAARMRLDFTGWVMIAAALACLVMACETIGRGLVPDWMVAALVLGGVVFSVAYAGHARRTPAPIMDLKLFKVTSFRASVSGGTLFRVAIGAVPFLLPLMLQLGFGMTAFESGVLTLSGALGSLVMKMVAGPILKWGGFRRVLAWNALVSGVFLGSAALFTPQTSHLLIMLLLLAGGFFRSLEFTGLNVLAVADIPDPKMAQATTMSSTAQQISLSLGVAAGALMLDLTMALHGGTSLGADDFWPAFVILGLLAASPLLLFLRLPPDTGAAITGHGVPSDGIKRAA